MPNDQACFIYKFKGTSGNRITIDPDVMRELGIKSGMYLKVTVRVMGMDEK